MTQQPTAFQEKAGPLPSFRSIAIAPPKILPRPTSIMMNEGKRKWNPTVDDSSLDLDLMNKKRQRRGSNSSQGSNTSISAAADQRKRRKEQNRAAQRAFRERKEKYVKELEDKIKEIEAANVIRVSQLEQENENLRIAMEAVQKEMDQLRKTVSPNPYGISVDNNLDSKVSATTDNTSPPYSNSQSPVVSTITTTTSPATTSTPRVPSSAVACIRDKDGVSFCERLKEEVCSNAYDQLLTEPLFDSHGLLNDSVAKHPVPIVTTDMSQDKKERSLTEMYDEFEQTLSATLSPSTKETANVDLISCSVVWNRMAKHPMFNKFNLEDLCDELKKKAKCSRNGPVFEEHEVKEVLELMEERVYQEEQGQTQQEGEEKGKNDSLS